MKTVLTLRLLLLASLLTMALTFQAHAGKRLIRGTVYQNGKAASGVKVTVHKSSSAYYTSFDGKFEVRATIRSKWIRFTFEDREETLPLTLEMGDTIDYNKGSAPETTKKKRDSKEHE
ncbi:MAG: hypothetical protein LWW85_03650 [Marinilabiliales bacterium]|nr:hypothetical protein [Marinilabiliales bacterium]